MSAAVIQIDSIVFRRDDEEDTDGYVIYLITKPCTERPCTHICLSHPERSHHYERQLFRRGSFGHRRNATEEEKSTNRANVWGWNGDVAAPSLQPSFLADRTKDADLGYRLHSYLNAGSLDLCGDSTVVPASNPVPCRSALE